MDYLFFENKITEKNGSSKSARQIVVENEIGSNYFFSCLHTNGIFGFSHINLSSLSAVYSSYIRQLQYQFLLLNSDFLSIGVREKELYSNYTDFCLRQFPGSGNSIYYTNLLSQSP